MLQPDIKSMQIQLTGFLDKDTPSFCKDLWKLLLSAQASPQGVPKELLEAKKMELMQEKVGTISKGGAADTKLIQGYRSRRTRLPKKHASEERSSSAGTVVGVAVVAEGLVGATRGAAVGMIETGAVLVEGGRVHHLASVTAGIVAAGEGLAAVG